MSPWETDCAIAIVLIVLGFAIWTAYRHSRRTEDDDLLKLDLSRRDFQEQLIRRQEALAAWGASIRSEGPVPPPIPEPTENWRADMRRRLGEQDAPAARWDEPMPEPPPEAADPGAVPAPLPEPTIEVQHGLTPENPDAPKEPIVPEEHPLFPVIEGFADSRMIDPRPIGAEPNPEPFIPYRERVFTRPGVPMLTYPDALTDTSSEPTQTGPQPDATRVVRPRKSIPHSTPGGAQPDAPQEPTLVDPSPAPDLKTVRLIEMDSLPPGSQKPTPRPGPPPTPPVVEILPVFRPLPPGFVAQAERVRGNRVKRVRGRIVSDRPAAPETDTPTPEDPA